MTHCTSVMEAPRSACRAGSATLTTVASIPASPDPRMEASRTQRPAGEENRTGSAGVVPAGGA